MNMQNRNFMLFFLLSITTVSLSACGGGGGGGGVGDTTPKNLEESLIKLGVDTTITPRLDSQGNDYPETYAPLGKVFTIRQIDAVEAGVEPTYAVGRPEELFLGGFRLYNRPFAFTAIDDISLAGLTELEGRFTVPDILEGRALVDIPWARETNNSPARNVVPSGTRRDATSIDIDGDGFLDSVLAYVLVRPDGPDELRLQIIDGDNLTPVLDFALLTGGSFLPAYDLRVSGADYDGDGRDELAIVVSRKPLPGEANAPVGVYIVDDELADFAVIHEHRLALNPTFSGSYPTLDIESFHADHDNHEEIAIVVNESSPLVSPPNNYASHYFVMGIQQGNLEELSSGPISATVYDTDGTRRMTTAVVASITTEDIDGDSLDELIFAGLEEVKPVCAQTDAGGEFVSTKYLLIAYGGKYNNFKPILNGASAGKMPPIACLFESGSEHIVIRHTHVNALDFDGDGDMDIQLNDMVFDNIPKPTIDWLDKGNLLARIEEPSLVYGYSDRRFFDRSESIITVSDQTGDGVKDIVALYASTPDNDPYIKVYSWDELATTRGFGYKLATRIRVDSTDMSFQNPIITPMDVDNDKVAVLRYTDEHFLDLTEPVVLAAIAAAPCKSFIGQDDCSSSWGSSQSGAVGRAFSVTVSGSAGAGAGAAGAGAFGKWLAKVNVSASVETSASYELSKSRTFSTGPLEDGVVFTAIPVDRYAYELIENYTDSLGVVGQRIEVRLPRDPHIRIVERGYFNSSVTADAEKIDDRVFRHTPGDTSTYPRVEDKDFTLLTQRDIIEYERATYLPRDRVAAFDLVPAEKGLEVGPVIVGQGGGATELGLEYTETVGASNSLAMGFSFEAEMLFGAAVSWEVGIEAGRTLSVSHGDSTLFSGSVDSISAQFYTENQYAFGLFAYLQKLGDQEIEVVNFWVEEE